MVSVKANSLEWAIKHLQKFYVSDFYPKQFEISAIHHNWPKVKDHILAIDLTDYTPKSPIVTLAPKPNNNYRVVHQLDPIDALIYTSLVYEISKIIEDFRIPETENIACSYRIKPDIDGSFFDKDDTGWGKFVSRTEDSMLKYDKGYILNCDITDFYNQIYIHKIRNLIAEAGKGIYDEQAKVLEAFLLRMNNKNSQGIPVGPAPSILLAEIIMADIDNRVLSYTRDFVRWVDDIRIFFDRKEDAIFTLHELSRYLYNTHRLVFSGEKTYIKSVAEFRQVYSKLEEKQEKEAVLLKTEEKAIARMEILLAGLPPYQDELYEGAFDEIFEEISKEEQFEVLSEAYLELVFNTLKIDKSDFVLLRHIMRKAGRYRIRSILPLVLENFEKLIPIIREVVIYLDKVIDEKVVKHQLDYFKRIFDTHFVKIPYVNIWLSYLLQNESFNASTLPSDYSKLLTVREQALVALRKKDINWVKGCKDNIEVLGAWDKRAVLFSSLLFPTDEMKVWVESIAGRGDIVDKSIAAYIISIKNLNK